MSTPSRVVASRQTMLLLNKEHRLSAGNDSRPICTLRLADRLFDDLFEEHFESLPELWKGHWKASGYPSQQVYSRRSSGSGYHQNPGHFQRFQVESEAPWNDSLTALHNVTVSTILRVRPGGRWFRVSDRQMQLKPEARGCELDSDSEGIRVIVTSSHGGIPAGRRVTDSDMMIISTLTRNGSKNFKSWTSLARRLHPSRYISSWLA